MASDALSAAKMQQEFENKALESVCTAPQGEEVELDWISELPDGVLIDIVSRLTLPEAITTSVLSRRWIDLWKSANLVLDFDGSEECPPQCKLRTEAARRMFHKMRRRYMKRVNGVVTQMQQSCCSRVSKFRISYNLTDECNSKRDMDRWVKFAISKRVESLHLALDAQVQSDSENNYVFPEECYNHIKTPAGLHDIRFLRSLRMSWVDVKNETLEHFIANCPLLEELSVKWSFRVTKLKVVGSSHSPLPLNHLEITNCFKLKSLEIDHVPRLERLIYGCGMHGKIQVGDCPSLVDMTLIGSSIHSENFKAFSGCASRLVSLFLIDNLLRPISVPAQHSNLERLVVQVVTGHTHSALRLIPLINACPRLHTLQLFFCTSNTDLYTCPRPLAGVVKKRRDSIKVVEVGGFRGYDIDYEFMEYVMEYFVGLERIVIELATTPNFINGIRSERTRLCSEEQLREAEKRALELKSRAAPTVDFIVI